MRPHRRTRWPEELVRVTRSTRDTTAYTPQNRRRISIGNTRYTNRRFHQVSANTGLGLWVFRSHLRQCRSETAERSCTPKMQHRVQLE